MATRMGRTAWVELVGEFERSGLTVREFCEQAEVSVSSLHRWRKLEGGRTSRTTRPQRGTVPAFVDLGALGAGAVGGCFEIRLELGNGVVLHLARR